MTTAEQIRRGGTTCPAMLTSTADGRDHLISEQATAAGLAAGRGEYVALCGHLVMAAPLVVPPGPTCVDCEAAQHRITTTSIASAQHRRGLLARLLRRCLPRPRSLSASGGCHGGWREELVYDVAGRQGHGGRSHVQQCEDQRWEVWAAWRRRLQIRSSTGLDRTQKRSFCNPPATAR